MHLGIDFSCFSEALGISFIDFWLENSMFGISQTRFSHGKYCKNRLLVEIAFYAFGDLRPPTLNHSISQAKIHFCCYFEGLGLVLSIFDWKFRCPGFPKRDFRMESIAKIDFWWKSLLMNFGIDFLAVFMKPWPLNCNRMAIKKPFNGKLIMPWFRRWSTIFVNRSRRASRPPWPGRPPVAMSHELWAMSHEPWTINNRFSSTLLFDPPGPGRPPAAMIHEPWTMSHEPLIVDSSIN